MKCPKCGNEVLAGQPFCMKCGQPVQQQPAMQRPQPPMPPQPAKAAMPPRPQMPQAPRPMAPQQPQRPMAPQPQMPQAPRPMQPQAPLTPGDKGFFTNAVRTVANAVTGGALNREIAREQQQAVRQQARGDQQQIHDAQQAQQTAEQAQLRAERDAQRAADSRAMELVPGVDVVRGRAIWNIQPGEIARRISERELEEVEKLKGIIVQEGCTAIIFANGELVSTLSAGAYLFYKSVEEEQAALKEAVEKAEKEMAEQERRARDQRRQNSPTFRQLGVVGEIGRGFSWLGRIIFGEKKNEAREQRQRRKIDYARLLARLTQAPVLSVYIVSDRYITMTFGGQPTDDGGINFIPYTIPTRIHDVEVGVSLQLRISNIHTFATNYLADRSSASVAMMQQLLNAPIEQLLRMALRNLDYEQTGLAPETVQQLKIQIQQLIAQQLHGIECTQVLQITDSNADFERFRQVERELYNTEKELEFLQRTGEFRNRIENETNSQQIQQAQNAEQLRYALQQINKDQLLHDDELEQFVQLLESQKRIREAKTQEEEFEALESLRGNRLVKQDEMDELEHQLARNKIPREEITEIMRIQSQQKVDEARLVAEWSLGDQREDHDWEREDLARRRNWGIEDEEREREWMQEEREYDRQRGRLKAEEDYDFEKMLRQRNLDLEDHARERAEHLEDEDRAYERQRQQMFDQDQLAANDSQRQMQNLELAMKLQMQSDAQEQQHEEEMARMKANEQMNRDNNFANMSAEQIRAAQLSHLTGEAQVAMANAYSKDGENELLRQHYKEAEERAARDKADMMNLVTQVAGIVKDTAASVSGAQQQQQQQQMQQMRADMQHAQERQDHAQDQAFNAMGGVATAAASNLYTQNANTNVNVQQQPPQQQPAPEQQPLPEYFDYECYNCHHVVKVCQGMPKCPNCGAPFQW